MGIEKPLQEMDMGAGKCSCEMEVPRNPDEEDLVNSTAYSTDAGICTDITKPNRVLEEFDYYPWFARPSLQSRDHDKGSTQDRYDDIIRIINPRYRILQYLHSQYPHNPQPVRNLLNLPDTDNSPGLNLRSTGRIFALLSPVEECAIVPVKGLAAIPS